MFMYLVLNFYASAFSIKMKEPTTLPGDDFLFCPENDIS